MTQSEYVKEELIRLRHNLQELEDRAVTIETDIRNAMSEGNLELQNNIPCDSYWVRVSMGDNCVSSVADIHYAK